MKFLQWTSYEKGLYGEVLSFLFLKIKGYKILSTRFKTRAGEIDIIAKKKNVIHIIEVKFRKSKLQAKESVNFKSRNRILNTTRVYLQKNPQYINCDISYDIVCVVFPCYVYHYVNIWNEADT
jgi:putative endonuclease